MLTSLNQKSTIKQSSPSIALVVARLRGFRMRQRDKNISHIENKVNTFVIDYTFFVIISMVCILVLFRSGPSLNHSNMVVLICVVLLPDLISIIFDSCLILPF